MTGFVEVAGLIGTAVSAAGSVLGGIQASQTAKAQADIAEQQANEQKAVAQREAARKAKEGRFILSSQVARAAASGGGADDPTVLQLMGDVGAESSYQQRAALYDGDSKAQGLEHQAEINRWQAKQSMLSGFIGAGSSVISGLSGWERYKTPTPTSYSGYPL